MTIDEQGFLSPDIQDWIRKHRTENVAWFALAEDLNGIGHRQLALLKVPAEDNQAFLTALLFMRGLSNYAAHPSVTALNRNVNADESGLIKGFRWGPEVTDVEDTLMTACTAAVYVIHLAKGMLNRDDISIGLDRCWEEYKRLVGAVAEKQEAE